MRVYTKLQKINNMYSILNTSQIQNFSFCVDTLLHQNDLTKTNKDYKKTLSISLKKRSNYKCIKFQTYKQNPNIFKNSNIPFLFILNVHDIKHKYNWYTDCADIKSPSDLLQITT